MKKLTLTAIIFTLITLFVNALSATAAPVDLSHLSSSERSEHLRAVSNGTTFYVNSTGDVGDSDPGNEICETANGNGICTLRAAIEEANDDNDHDIIYFDFPGATTIEPTSSLPLIEKSVTIDGVSNSGDPTATCPDGTTPATLPITLSGANVDTGGSTGYGLYLFRGADDSTIRGLNLILWKNNWGNRSAIILQGRTANQLKRITIRCNNVGTNGISTNQGNDIGIELRSGVDGVGIGGPLISNRNVISGNGTGITGSAKDYLRISGNYIGVAEDGVTPIGNENYGIDLASIGYGDVDISINGNYAESIIANNGVGIHISYAYEIDSETHVGIDRNSIHNNQGNGIEFTPGYSDGFGPFSISHNSIFANGGLGIDLENDGVTLPDLASNMNAPTLWEVAGGTQLRFSFKTSDFDPSSSYRFAVFYSDSCNESGYGEGQTYQQSFTLTPLTAYSIFEYTLLDPLPANKYITLTAYNNTTRQTSEFSNCINETNEINFVIDSLLDNADALQGNGICADTAGNCTLRAALQESNALIADKLFRLTVDIPGSAITILLKSSLGPLPPVTKQIFFDGTTKEGSSCPTASTPAIKILRVRGTSLSPTSDGLVLGAGSDGSTIQGLSLEGFGGTGLSILSDDNRIYCSEFGSGLSGGFGNAVGVAVSGDDNHVGGSFPAYRNVIARNTTAGVELTGSASRNSVLGNYIGLTSDGTTIATNSNAYGIHLQDSANNNYIGAYFMSVPGDVQTIRGYNYFGRHLHSIWVDGDGMDNYVGGNIIGQFPDRTPHNLTASSHGIRIDAPDTQVGFNRRTAGGVASAIPNIVGKISASGSGIWVGGDNAVIHNNFVGISMDGSADLSNLGNGITLVGDDAYVARNKIGNNNNQGIFISSGSHVIETNLIGLEADGSTPAGNGRNGISVNSSFNIIRSNAAGFPNVIVNNGHNGIYVDNDVTFTQIVGNRIRDNVRDGIMLHGSADSNHFFGNVISGNGQLPIDINNDSTILPNDPKDADSGSNDLMNRVTIDSAIASSGNIAISFNGEPDTLHYVEFYTSADCTGTNGYGSLQVLHNFTTDSDGNYSGTITQANFYATQGVSAITSNFVSLVGPASSSEFSDCRAAIGTTPPATLQVNNAGDIVDSNGCNLTHCTLREAIIDANALTDANVIQFKTGMTINIDAATNPLPEIINRVTIDGTAGSTGATCPNFSAPANLNVVIDGNNSLGDALTFVSDGSGNPDGSVVRGLRIAGFLGAAVKSSFVDSLNVECNVLGDDSGDNVTGNYYGVYFEGGANSVIGGFHSSDRNVISGNFVNGIRIDNRAADTTIVHNYLGTTNTADECASNGYQAIAIGSGVHDVAIGTSPSNGNVIACSQLLGGVQARSGSGIAEPYNITVRFNSMFGNAIGIDLGGNFLTLNDPDDVDTGANSLINFPTIDGATINGQLSGKYDGANGTYTIDVYQNDYCHPSGYGEGQTWLDSFAVTVSLNGSNPNGVYDETITAPSGTYTHLTMTATDSDGNTSEFSECFAVGTVPTAVGLAYQETGTGIEATVLVLLTLLFAGMTAGVLVRRRQR